MGHLDRRQLADMNRRPIAFFLDKLIIQLHYAPYSTAEQAVVFGRIVLIDGNAAQSKV